MAFIVATKDGNFELLRELRCTAELRRLSGAASNPSLDAGRACAGRVALEGRTVHMPDVFCRSGVHALQRLHNAEAIRTLLRFRSHSRGRADRRHRRSPGVRSDPSPTSRSSCSRPSPTKPSSPSRTRGCSRRSRRASASCRSRSNTRPRPATCSASSAGRRPSSSRCSTRLSRSAARFATPTMPSCLPLRWRSSCISQRSHGLDRGDRDATCADLDPMPAGPRYGRARCDAQRRSTTSLTCWPIRSTVSQQVLRCNRRSAAMLAVPLMRKDGEAIGTIAVACVARRGHFHGQTDRAAANLRRPGRHRHREHAAVRGGAGAHAAS